MSMAKSIAASMPQELIDAIAGQLHADEDWCTLGSFGLVQRSWLPSSRHYLFSSVSLSSSNVDAFLEILTSPDCIMAPYVRRLELQQEHGKLLNKFLPHGRPLSGVKALVIEELRWEDLIPEAEEILLSGFLGIIHLELYRSKFDSFGQFISFVAEFSSLELLSLKRGDWDEYYGGSSTSEAAEKAISPQLTTLKASVDSPCKRELVRWLLRSQPIPAINTIDLHDVSDDEAPSIARLTQALGPALQHLRLGFDIYNASDNLRQAFDLAQNTELRSICLDSDGWIYPGVTNVARCFPTILSTISSHAIEEIIICLEHPVFESLEVCEWEAMASLFAAPQFSGLRSIHFRIFGLRGIDERALEMLIKERLGQCASRGILSVETGQSRGDRLMPAKLVPTIM